jgi:hypothetical protein
MERINQIKEITGYTPDGGWATYSGYQIETSKQVIYLLIYDQQECCENWGYLITEDDPAAFVGANLRTIKVTDINRLKVELDALEWLDDGGVLFVDIETSRGVLQFVAYNAHNGYYGHVVRIVSGQLNLEEVL